MKRKKLGSADGRVGVVDVPTHELQGACKQRFRLLTQRIIAMFGQQACPLVVVQKLTGGCGRHSHVQIGAGIGATQNIFVRAKVE